MSLCPLPAVAEEVPDQPRQITVTGPTEVSAQVGAPVNAIWTATGGTDPYQWGYEPLGEADLPQGLTFANGVLSGTPTEAGTAHIYVFAANRSADLVGGMEVTIEVAPAPTPDPLVITPATDSLSLIEGVAMQHLVIEASGGVPTEPLAWSMEGAPAGLILTQAADGRSASISGTPTEAGQFTATVTATPLGRAELAPATTTIFIKVEPASAPDLLVLNGERALKAPVDQETSFSFQAEGGKAPYTYGIKWNFTTPSGTSFDTETGTLTVNSQQVGTSYFTVTVTDAYGTQASLLGSLEIASYSALTITPNSLVVYPDNTTSQTFSQTFTASGGFLNPDEKYEWSADWSGVKAGTLVEPSFVVADDGMTAYFGVRDVQLAFASKRYVVITVKDSLGDTATATITLEPQKSPSSNPPQNEGDGTGKNLIVNREPFRQNFPNLGGGLWGLEGLFPPGTIIDDNPYIPTPENVAAAMGTIFGEVEVAKKEPDPKVAYGHKYVLKDAEGNPHQPGEWITINGKGYIIYDVYEKDGEVWFKLSSEAGQPSDPSYEVKQGDLSSMIATDYTRGGFFELEGAYIVIDGILCTLGTGADNGNAFDVPVLDGMGRYVGTLYVPGRGNQGESNLYHVPYVDTNGFFLWGYEESYTPRQTPLGEQYKGTTEDGRDFEVTLVGSTDLTPVAPDGTIAQPEGNVQVSQTIQFDELTAVYDHEEGAEAGSKVENAIIAMQNIHNGTSYVAAVGMKRGDAFTLQLKYDSTVAKKAANATLSQTTNRAYEVSAAFPGMSPFVTYVITGEAVDDLVAQSEQETPADTTQTPSAPAATETRPTTYTVCAGDTLSQLAERFGTTVDALVAANANLIRDPNLILTGWLIAIP